MNRKLLKIIASSVLLAVAWLIDRYFELPTWQLLLIYLVPYLIAGFDVLHEAAEGIMEGDPFDENFLMSVATIGALSIGFLPGAEPEFAEAVFVMLFFQVGEFVEHLAEHESRSSVSSLMELRPATACVLRGGKEESVAPEEVAVGESIILRPGDRVPIDGVISDGTSSLNVMAITGESVPLDVSEGDTVVSGSINLSGVLRVVVSKAFADSTVAKIISLVEHASEKKSKKERFIRKFARVYTPAVVFVALAVALLPPLFSESYSVTFPLWLYRALTFLVVSCPCALVISVPLSFFGGIGGASRSGILIKGATHIDTLANLETVVLDKTGTLTHGEFEVAVVHPRECDEKHLLHLAAHVERHSTHPIAMSLLNAYPGESDDCTVEDVEELAGLGVRATVNGSVVCVGNERMMRELGIEPKHDCSHPHGTTVHVGIDGEYAGHIVVADKIKPEADSALRHIKQLGVRKTVMLSGDNDNVASQVAATLGIDEWHASLLPADKVQRLEDLLEQRTPGKTLAFVGDGINDAPVLARADVGIAMGGLGSDAAIEAADVVIMDDNPEKIAKAIHVARRTIGIATQNIWFAIAVKLAVLVLAFFGIATMWMAVFADVGVTVIALLNALRALSAK